MSPEMHSRILDIKSDSISVANTDGSDTYYFRNFSLSQERLTFFKKKNTCSVCIYLLNNSDNLV